MYVMHMYIKVNLFLRVVRYTITSAVQYLQ